MKRIAPLLLVLFAISAPAFPQSNSEAENYYNEALGNISRKNTRGAIEALTEAIRLDPLMIKAYEKRRALYESAGRLREAAKDLGKVAAIKSYNHGVASVQENRPGEAVRYFTDAVDADPEFHLAYYRLALARAAGRDYRGAINDLDDAIAIVRESGDRLNPSDLADAYYFRALFKVKEKDYEGAVVDATQTLNLDSKYVDAYLTKGEALQKRGRTLEAIAVYRDALNPGRVSYNAEVRNALILALIEQGQYQEAVREFKKLALNDQGAESYSNLGLAYYGLKNFEEAQKALEIAYKRENNNPVILDRLGDVYLKLSMPDEARNFWQRAKLYAKDNPQHAQLTQQLGDKISDLNNSNRKVKAAQSDPLPQGDREDPAEVGAGGRQVNNSGAGEREGGRERRPSEVNTPIDDRPEPAARNNDPASAPSRPQEEKKDRPKLNTGQPANRNAADSGGSTATPPAPQPKPGNTVQPNAKPANDDSDPVTFGRAQKYFLDGLTLYNSGRSLVEAKKHFQKAILLQPGYLEPVKYIYRIYQMEGQQEEGLDFVLDAADGRDPLKTAKYVSAELLKEGKHDWALDLLLRAKQHYPRDAGILRELGNAYFQKKKYDKARDSLELALSLDKQNPETLELMGDVYQQLKDLKLAEKMWKQALPHSKDQARINSKLQSLNKQVEKISNEVLNNRSRAGRRNLPRF
jgi:tetratricopeptide (TPR) repeat protein